MSAIHEPELRLGRWQDVSAGIVADAVICDPPYGARTHSSKQTRNDKYEPSGAIYNPDGLAPDYPSMSHEDVREFVASWSARCRGWMVALTCSDLAPVWRSEFESAGRCAFAPVPCVIRGMTVRLSGDGPSSWAIYAMVARPAVKRWATWGTLQGAYVGPVDHVSASGHGRGKPDWLMQALVRDYSRPGDLIVDPFCGWGSTLIAARALGRRSIGIDVDAAALDETRRRLTRPAQPSLFMESA